MIFGDLDENLLLCLLGIFYLWIEVDSLSKFTEIGLEIMEETGYD